MEQDDLDKMFRDLIQNDKSELNEQERNSKKAIWDEIGMPKKEKKIFPFWQVAAAVLLLLLGGTSWFFINKINQQNTHFAQLEKELLLARKSLQTVQHQFATLEANMGSESYNNEIVNDEIAKVEAVTVLQKEVVEKIVYLKDTVFLEKNIAQKEVIQLVRDTVFIEVPVKRPMRLVDLDTLKKEDFPREKFSKKKKKSQKMEFVFGKKPLEKPSKKNQLILINDSGIAKKSERNNKSNVFTIPIIKN